MRLAERRHAIGNDRVALQLRQPRPGHQHAEKRAGFVYVHARRLAEGNRRRVGKTIDQPLLTEIVIDHEQAVGLQPIAYGAE